ncbi:DUF397 domain-containing protein [Kribbella antibiotica]|uniref:DUF397 domain-containing protein n=1 Tax=Kribbella antibiotica TaxID=190195 RepID=A0A4R4ZI08_9ACTN|nr:DUF397 domain-containing protein [Kribbella antibiotica]TDD58213.1 DUF397 domain-containing protein [Kribbella antibiotica]
MSDLDAAAWRKSIRSNGGGNCIEVAFLDDGRVAVRDTKDSGTGPVLRFTPGEWNAFILGVKDGEFDR